MEHQKHATRVLIKKEKEKKKYATRVKRRYGKLGEGFIVGRGCFNL